MNTKKDESNIDGNCSLREAIEAANTNAPVDRCKAGSATERDAIHFSLGKKATITLDSQLPEITDPSGLSINGQQANITISGNHSVRIFNMTNSDAKLALKNLTVADANFNGVAGAINTNGTLEVTNSTFSGNSASLSSGAIDNGGTLTINNSTFSDNTSPSGVAGAIRNSFAGTLTVNNSTFADNSALAGGGILNDNTSMSLTVTNSTFSNNSANSGSGIANSGSLQITNSTFSENSASSGATIESSSGTTTLRSTIVANPTQGSNCSGTITDGGYNIDDSTTCGFSAANNSKPNTDPLLDPEGLQNNGGPTKTIKLLPGSPAVSVIPKSTNGCGMEIKEDQRGVKRPQGPGCDIGAFEKKRHVQPNQEETV